jgi:multiple sugar transport system substrate-binding protein
MKKSILCLAFLLAIPLVLFGQSSALAGVDPSGQTVSFWYQHSQDRDTAMKKLIDEFNSTNPWKITVNGSYEGNYNQIYNKMIAALAAGNPPGLVVAYQNQAATYEVNDSLVDLNPYVNDPKWGMKAELSDFIQGFINQDVNAMFGGKRLGFPPNRSIEVLYYNQILLKSLGVSAPPRTWDEFASDCRKATDKAKDTYGYALDNIDASHVFGFVISRGGSIARADGRGYTLNTPQVKDAMVFMRDLYRQGYARKVAKQYDDQNEFGNGKCLFTVSSTSGLPFYDAAVKAGKSGPFPWNVAPVPQTSTSRPPAIDLYGASVSVPKTDPRKQLAAWLFIKWFSEPKQQAAWTMVSRYFPVRKSAEPLIKGLFDSDPRFATAWNLLKSVDLKSEPPYAGYDLVRDAISAAYSRILEGADPDATLSDLEAQANKIFKDSAP